MESENQSHEDIISRGVAECIHTESLKKKLSSQKTLRIKLGIDPTSPNIHLGRVIPLLKMRDFQKLGHTAVFIVGDFTGVIGDTSDKESERPMLTEETIKQNMDSYVKQVSKIIDMDNAEVHYNSTWLKKLNFNDVGELANHFSVADFIARDNIRRRLDVGKRVSLREVLYPLMQGYDSVAVHADVELGGVDQRFNLLAGRVLQEKAGLPVQDIIMTELIPGTDGRKMSSSWGNTINMLDTPHDMYGKIMSIPDMLLEQYFTLITRLLASTIQEALQGHPKDAKMILARTIVSLFSGDKEAQEAEDSFKHTFEKSEFPTDTLVVSVAAGTNLVSVLLEEGFVDSKSEYRRLVEGNAIMNMQSKQRITDFDFILKEPLRLRIGKHRFIEIKIK